MGNHVGMHILHNWLIWQWTFQNSYVNIAYLAKKTSEEFGSTLWVLWGGNVTNCSLMIMDMGIAQLAKIPSYNFGNMMQVL